MIKLRDNQPKKSDQSIDPLEPFENFKLSVKYQERSIDKVR